MMNSVTKAMRVFAFLAAISSLLLFAPTAQAYSALPPGHAPIKYTRWAYPSQTAYGPLETGLGNLHQAAAPGAFPKLGVIG